MDALCRSVGPVVPGCRELVHPWWLHPCVAGPRTDRGRPATDSGQARRLRPRQFEVLASVIRQEEETHASRAV